MNRIKAFARPGWAGEPHVQPDRHHARAVGAFFVKEIEAIAQEREKVFARAEDATPEFRIVGGQRIRHDQMRAAGHPHPIRQLVVVGIAVVEEPAMLDKQPAGVLRRRIAAVPAQRGLAGRLLD